MIILFYMTKKFEKHTIGITWKYPQGYQKKRP